jgi:hypothetical protein
LKFKLTFKLKYLEEVGAARLDDDDLEHELQAGEQDAVGAVLREGRGRRGGR